MGHGHNNVIPNAHFHKDWQRRVKTWFDQPAAKKRRRLHRVAKAAKVFPRPVAGPLRPIVRGQTVRYNRKVLLGRGFSLQELKEAGLSKLVAQSLGIAVDHRRRNISDRGLKENVHRLKVYRSKQVLFPRRKPKAGKNGKKGVPAKKGDAPATELAKVKQVREALPLKRPTLKTKHRVIAPEELNVKTTVFQRLRHARADARLAGVRKKRAAEKAAQAALLAGKE